MLKNDFCYINCEGNTQQLLTYLHNYKTCSTYCFDIPRSFRNIEKLREVYACAEKLLDCIIPASVMYGGLKSDMRPKVIKPCNVLIFCNDELALKHRMLSDDRFEAYKIGRGVTMNDGHLVPFHYVK